MEQNLKVNENEYLPLRDVVFNTLRQAILRGEFKPGERLMEIQLANKLGVSRTPIREAIRKLELEGLGHYDSEKRCGSGGHYGEKSARCAGSQKSTGRTGSAARM